MPRIIGRVAEVRLSFLVGWKVMGPVTWRTSGPQSRHRLDPARGVPRALRALFVARPRCGR